MTQPAQPALAVVGVDANFEARCAAAGLTAHQTAVARRALAEEAGRRAHVVIALSGAHAYGFPSPDSDLDLKAVHLADTAALVGLAPAKPTADRAFVEEGVEIDYTSNELGMALVGLLKGNGNYLERALGPHLLVQGPWLEAFAGLAQRALSKRVHWHYRGFAESQRKSLDEKPTVKRLLYVLRTALTGAHALRAGAIVTDLPTLAAEHGFADVPELVARKREGEKTGLPKALAKHLTGEVARAFALLDEARAGSQLPDAPSAETEAVFNRFLIDLRRERFGGHGQG